MLAETLLQADLDTAVFAQAVNLDRGVPDYSVGSNRKQMMLKAEESRSEVLCFACSEIEILQPDHEALRSTVAYGT